MAVDLSRVSVSCVVETRLALKAHPQCASHSGDTTNEHVVTALTA